MTQSNLNLLPGVRCGSNLTPIRGLRDAEFPLDRTSRPQLCLDLVGSAGCQGEGGTNSSLPSRPGSHLQSFPASYGGHSAASDSGDLPHLTLCSLKCCLSGCENVAVIPQCLRLYCSKALYNRDNSDFSTGVCLFSAFLGSNFFPFRINHALGCEGGSGRPAWREQPS